MLQLFKPQVK